ncbi:MAG: pseudouridine synthase [Proteobacteria bacterium]|nr:pseudouridine synthase [Pseudomonadota bacterium]
MKSKAFRLDRFVRAHTTYSAADTRGLIAQGRILLDGEPAGSIQQRVTAFTRVHLDGICLQDNEPVYIMLNKPKGVVSATKDARHTTVLDIIEHPQKASLHIAGRLDFNTTGLILLTNDGAWSRKITEPDSKLAKEYQVRLKSPVSEDYIKTFKAGMFFPYEGITTAPATLTLLTEHTAKLRITEGKYHQIKRMFGRFQNEVVELHRTSVGSIVLDETLAYGDYRSLTPAEVATGFQR